MNSFRSLPQNVPSAVSNRSGKLSRRTSFRGDSTTPPAAWLPAAHQALLLAAEERGKPMCCTLDLVLVQGECAYLAHVGDSRVYHQTGGMMSALTCDHTLAQKLAELGLGEIEALNTRWQHVLSMAIGSQNGVEPQILSVGLLPGDRLLLCSDGVHGELADDSIQRLLVGAPAMAGWSLVKRVADLEGSDDATLVVIEKQ